ncbi:MAG: anthranilate phosphoribosyltransferase [Actinomycetota bacterium]
MTGLAPFGGWAGLLSEIVDGRDLTRDMAQAALADILAGEATPAQMAGLIVGLRLKGETTEELTGLASAMLAAAEPLRVPDASIDIVGTGGSAYGRANALNISTMACFVAAGAGATICKHGNRKASSTSGAFDFLEAIGVGIDMTPAQLEACIAEYGLGFAFARTFHPSMRFVGPVRVELGIPTVFNVLGPLANPGRVTRQVIGTTTVELAAKMAQTLQNLGSELAWVVSGDGGVDELTTTGPTTVFVVTPAAIDRIEIDASAVGLAPVASLTELEGGDPAENARIFRAILDGEEKGPRRDIVVLNAAAGLVVAGLADDLEAGVARSEAALDDGRAAAKLASLGTYSAALD